MVIAGHFMFYLHNKIAIKCAFLAIVMHICNVSPLTREVALIECCFLR